MFIIREHHLEALQREARAGFEDRMVRHFIRFFPELCEAAGGEPQILALVRHGISRAESHGYLTQTQVATFLGLMFPLGEAFDRDPQLPGMAQRLADLSVPSATDRIMKVQRWAMDYLGRTAGDRGEYTSQALVRIRAFDLRAAGNGGEDYLCATLERFHPRKFAVQGEAAMRAMIWAGVEAARGYGITGPTGLLVYTTLMFLLGSGFDQAFLHAWAGRALTDPTVPDEAARVERLYRDAMVELSKALDT